MKLILSLIVLFLFFYSIFPHFAFPAKDDVSVKVFFCPETDCMALFESVVEEAKTSIHCSLYDLSENFLPLFDSKLNYNLDSKKQFDLGIVYHADQKLSNRDYLHKRKANSLSHNKFCVIDGKFVWTGSFNPTGNKNHNDVLLINSRVLADNYEQEYKELIANKKKLNSHPIINSENNNNNNLDNYNNIKIENYFCPDDGCQDKAIDALSEAKKSIYVMAYSFTNKEIGALLLAKKELGVDVKVIFEARQIDDDSVYSMINSHIFVKASNHDYLLHYKAFIIDNSTVITGSANPSKNGYFNNDENILILHNPLIALQYAHKFMEEWQNDSLLRQKTN